MSSVFISFSAHHEDSAVARALAHELERRGLSVLWIARSQQERTSRTRFARLC
jgi:hypothetical protein